MFHITEQVAWFAFATLLGSAAVISSVALLVAVLTDPWT